MKRTLIINDVAPPVVQGGSILLGKLFKWFPESSIYIFTGSCAKQNKTDSSYALSCPRFLFPLPTYEKRGKWNRGLFILLQLLCVSLIVLKGSYLVKRYQIENIFAPVNRGIFFVSSFFISKLMNKRLFVYIPDIYEGVIRTKVEKIIAAIFGKRIFNHASRVFVLNDFLYEYYKNKYHIMPVIIPTSVDLSLYKKQNIIFNEDGSKEKRIVFTGMIYWAQLDAILSLVDIINNLDKYKVKLFIYSPFSQQHLNCLGIKGKNIIINYASADEIPSIQKSADILFLPLTFNPIFPLLTKTASPTKLAEYLAAEKPILIHAPSDCFLSYYARKEGFGYVVDKFDKNELKDALMRILEDKALQRKLTENAKRTVGVHDARVVSERLKYYLW